MLMRRTFKYILLSFLMACCGCDKDKGSVTETPDQGLDFNLVTIDNVSEAAADGFRTIELRFSDREGNSLEMKAGSGYKHLEAGWYDITSEADAKLKAEINLNMEGRDVTVNGGSVFVRKKDYEYLIRFVIETDGEAISAIADAKKLYFESEEYASISSGSEGCYLKDQTIRSEILNSVP